MPARCSDAGHRCEVVRCSIPSSVVARPLQGPPPCHVLADQLRGADTWRGACGGYQHARARRRSMVARARLVGCAKKCNQHGLGTGHVAMWSVWCRRRVARTARRRRRCTCSVHQRGTCAARFRGFVCCAVRLGRRRCTVPRHWLVCPGVGVRTCAARWSARARHVRGMCAARARVRGCFHVRRVSAGATCVPHLCPVQRAGAACGHLSGAWAWGRATRGACGRRGVSSAARGRGCAGDCSAAYVLARAGFARLHPVFVNTTT